MLGHKKALETQVGEDVKLVSSVLPSPICSSWRFWRISTSACAGGGSLPLCLAPLQLRFLSSVLWKVRWSKRQLCAWRCWAGVQMLGGDRLPWAEALLRDQMPSPKEKQKEKSEQGRVRPGQSAERRGPCCLLWAPGMQGLWRWGPWGPLLLRIFACLHFPFTDITVVFVIMILRSSGTIPLNADTYLECGVRVKAYQLIP